MSQLIGKIKTSTAIAASCLWSINEQFNALISAKWPVPGARYWRLYFTDVQTASYLLIGEIELRSSLGGANVASGKTIAASSYYSYPPANAFDANVATGWEVYPTPINSWVSVDMGTNIQIKEYTIQVSTSYSAYGPKTWSLQLSLDNTNWYTVHTVTNASAWSEVEKRTYNGF